MDSTPRWRGRTKTADEACGLGHVYRALIVRLRCTHPTVWHRWLMSCWNATVRGLDRVTSVDYMLQSHSMHRMVSRITNPRSSLVLYIPTSIALIRNYPCYRDPMQHQRAKSINRHV